MPRPRQWPPTVHNHRGRARVRIDGRDYYLGPYGSDEAAREYARLVAQAASGAIISPETAPTVADVVGRFLGHAEATYSDEGGQTVRFRRAFVVLLGAFQLLPAADFRVPQLDAVRRAMIDLGWCRTHCNRMVVRIRTAWRWAEQQGLVPEGRWAHLRSLKALPPNHRGVKHSTPRRPCTREELTRVQRECPPAVAAMLELQWLTGMRSCEVRTMRPCDIDRAGQSFCTDNNSTKTESDGFCTDNNSTKTLDRTGEVWLYRPAHHKTEHLGQQRVIALGPECRAVLGPWLDVAPDAYLFRSLKARRRKGAAGVLSETPYTTCSYARCVARAAERAGVEGLHPYQARHAAKRRIVRQYGADAARAVLGQRHIETTLLYDRGQDVAAAVDVAREAC